MEQGGGDSSRSEPSRGPAPGGLPARALVEEQLGRGLVVLRFSPDLEKPFQRHYLAAYLTHIRMSILVGLVIFGAFGALDAVLFPRLRSALWTLRYGVACPAVLAALACSLRAGKPERLQPVYAVAMFVVGCVLIAMMTMSHDVAVMYYSSLILLAIFAYAFSGVMLRYAAVSAVGITLVYVVVSLSAGNLEAPMLMNNISGLVATNVIGLVTGYYLERYRRKDFLQTILLRIDKRDLEVSNERLRELSYVDALTNIGNRRAFEVRFQQEWNRAMRYRYPVALLMIDIDHFKRLNDELGHQVGDDCLMEVASILRMFGSRPGDVAARYGGEEFVLLLSGTDAAGAARIAEDIRARVEAVRVGGPLPDPSRRVTVSIGLTSVVPSPSISREQVLGAADAALYRAKAGGRNRTVIQDVLGEPAALPAVSAAVPPRR